jgi:ankyrin repeat protein
LLVDAIAGGDAQGARRLLARVPSLSVERADQDRFLDGLDHHLYRGDSALHVAAAAHLAEVVEALLECGADVSAANRRGAQPLHYAADGIPGSHGWNPTGQAATIARLLAAGADPNAVDRNAATPLHRAVRTRCASAVEALLAGGADAERKNGSGSSPLDLAKHSSGRGGSGSPAAREEQREILRLLGATV